MITDHPWMNGQFYINNQGYTVKHMTQHHPEFTWESVMTTIKGDKAKNFKAVYPANQFHIYKGDFPNQPCFDSPV